MALAVVAAGLWRPAARVAALATVAPLASVAVLAWLGRNPFNGSMFATAALLLAAIAWRLEGRPLRSVGTWPTVAGLLAIGFGWLYPHFLDDRPGWVYLVAAPLGLVPCPTLSVVIGLSLCTGAFGSRAFGLLVSALGLLYGAFGVLRLGVWLDLPLVAVAIAGLAAGLRSTGHHEHGQEGRVRAGRHEPLR